jgi:Tol biopolymer transport system component
VTFVDSSVFFCLIAAVALSSGCTESTAPDDSSVKTAYVHTRASWAPDRETIAFRSESGNAAGIYLINSSGANLRLLLAGEGVGYTWSPDSRWLAFSALGSLFKIRTNGDSLTQLTSGTSDIRPAWSPDGTRIAFVRTGVWLLSLDSLAVRSLSTTGDFPSWLPNGDEVVVLNVGQQQSNLQFPYSVDAITAATGESRTLYSFLSSDDCGFGSISPKGDNYIFSAKPDKGLSQIWVVYLAIPMIAKLTTDGGDYPTWSPDTRILYTRTAEKDGALWLMYADGSFKRRLTSP